MSPLTLSDNYYYAKSKPITVSLAWTLWFSVCATPFSFEGVSINYLFVLTPLIYHFRGGTLFYPTNLLRLFFIVCVMIFVIATIYQVQFYEFGIRRLISFILFISLFSLTLIDFNKKMINSFLLSTVLVSVYFSILSIFGFISSGVSDPASLKDIIGTQRIGFFYIFSLWILFETILNHRLSARIRTLAFTSIGIIFIGIIFTFSRSSYVALAGGLLFTLGFYLFRGHFKTTWLKKLIYIAFSIAIFLVVTNTLLPQIYSFLDQRLFSLISSGTLSDNLTNSDTSEGTRIAIWSLVNDFVIQNPFTGSGFLGSWVLSNWTGSAHNEFFDRFLRLGFIGFMLYLLIIYKLYKFLIHSRPALAFGFVSILIYGLFHETFSQSHGAIIFSFLLMLYTRSYRQSRQGSKIT